VICERNVILLAVGKQKQSNYIRIIALQAPQTTPEESRAALVLLGMLAG